MPRLQNHNPAATAFSICAAIAVAIVPTSVRAEIGCVWVHGQIQSAFTTTNCTSPVHLCTVGKITGAGLLDATTTFTALGAAPSAGLPGVEATANLSYSGILTISTRFGTLVTHDLGVVDSATMTFTELDRPASGTGIFNNPSNVFFASGSVVNSGMGFDGELSGKLCIEGYH